MYDIVMFIGSMLAALDLIGVAVMILGYTPVFLVSQIAIILATLSWVWVIRTQSRLIRIITIIGIVVMMTVSAVALYYTYLSNSSIGCIAWSIVTMFVGVVAVALIGAGSYREYYEPTL